MKIIKFLFYLILNIAISAGAVWVMFSYINRGEVESVEPSDESVENVEIASVQNVFATVVPDKLIIESVISAGDISYERVSIQYVSNQEISLSGWELWDANGNTYVFPPLNMYAGSSLTVFSKVGSNSVTELYWGKETAVWETGEILTIVDPAGYPQAMYVIP